MAAQNGIHLGQQNVFYGGGDQFVDLGSSLGAGQLSVNDSGQMWDAGRSQMVINFDFVPQVLTLIGGGSSYHGVNLDINDAFSQSVLKYVTRGALPPCDGTNDSACSWVDANSVRHDGALGLCPQAASGIWDVPCAKQVAATLLAFNNESGLPRRISFRSGDVPQEPTLRLSDDFPFPEGAYYLAFHAGSVVSNDGDSWPLAEGYGCILDGGDSVDNHFQRVVSLESRVCAGGGGALTGATCLAKPMGSCFPYMAEDKLCDSQDPDGGFVSGCWDTVGSEQTYDCYGPSSDGYPDGLLQTCTTPRPGQPAGSVFTVYLPMPQDQLDHLKVGGETCADNSECMSNSCSALPGSDDTPYYVCDDANL